MTIEPEFLLITNIHWNVNGSFEQMESVEICLPKDKYWTKHRGVFIRQTEKICFNCLNRISKNKIGGFISFLT